MSGDLHKQSVDGDLEVLSDAITDLLDGHPPQLAMEALIVAFSEVILNCVAPENQHTVAEGFARAMVASVDTNMRDPIAAGVN